MPKHHLNEEPPSNIQSEPSGKQLHAIRSGPINGHQREGISTCPSTLHYEEAVDCGEVFYPHIVVPKASHNTNVMSHQHGVESDNHIS